MEFKYQDILPEEAQRISLQTIMGKWSLQTENVYLREALNRVAAEEYRAMHAQPPFDRAAVDGYAVRVSDIVTASPEAPVTLSVIDEIHAGDCPGKPLQLNTAIRIMTGAAVPPGANAVLRQEASDYGEELVKVYEGLREFENICFKGEDYRAGETLITKGKALQAIEIGLLASMGYSKISVYKKPRIALVTTGDELVIPGETLLPGKIYDANLELLHARLLEWNQRPVITRKLSDSEKKVAAFLEKISREVDLIITTGGVSVGKLDIMHDALRLAQADKIFWRVRMKPGAPTVFAMVNDVPVIALSGNPFGALANMELLVRPILQLLSGETKSLDLRRKAIIQNNFLKRSNCRRYIRGIYHEGSVTLPPGLQSSGVLRTMLDCNCLIEIPAGSLGLKQGDSVEVVMLD